MSITEYTGDLKVFTWDHEEWVIASDPEDAANVWIEHIDAQFTSPSDDDAVWEEEPPGKVFRLDDGDAVTAKTCAEWARDGKRGYFASANY